MDHIKHHQIFGDMENGHMEITGQKKALDHERHYGSGLWL